MVRPLDFLVVADHAENLGLSPMIEDAFQTFRREDAALVRFITSRKFMLFALLLGAVHLFFMGYQGWIDPAGWHGGLPPISLVAFTIFTIGYVINLFGRE